MSEVKPISSETISEHTRRLYIGTQQVGPHQGISVADFDATKGSISNVRLAAETKAPCFLKIHPNGRWLYATNSNCKAQGYQGQLVKSFNIDLHTGSLKLQNSQDSQGPDPNYLDFDAEGNSLLVANYMGGNLARIAIQTDGSLGTCLDMVQHHGVGHCLPRQKQPYAHSVKLSPGGQFALVADLGLDKVFIYRLAENGRIVPHTPASLACPLGTGPRHLLFGPGGNRLYYTNEIDSTITTCSWDETTGRLEILQSDSTLPDNWSGEPAASDLLLDPSGRFLVAAVRGTDSLALFSVDQQSGLLTRLQTLPCGGIKPRNVLFDPEGHWLLVSNQASDNISIFALDAKQGCLTLHALAPISNPLGMAFLG